MHVGIGPVVAMQNDAELNCACADTTAWLALDSLSIFGTHDGAVLQLPRQTTVIWMSEDRE